MSLLCNAFKINNSVCVNTGEVIISSNNLTTSFVNTCTVIAFKYENIKFMAHLDDLKPNMENLVNEKLLLVDLSKIKKIYIWIGSKCFNNCPSLILAKKISKKIGIKKTVYLKSTDNIISI